MHPNAELARQGYVAFNSGDLETLTRLFADDAQWHTPGRAPVAGDRSGRDTVLAHFGRYMEATGGTFRAELRHVLADDDGHVIAVHRNTGERNGKRLDVECLLAFQFVDGQCVDGREHFYDLGAWDEFWS